MKILHTGDWHLGRLFYGIHLTDDQANVLSEFIKIIWEYKPDIILIAGDIFDRAVPPPDAVLLFSEILTQIALDFKVQVIIIPGNHDSPERLSFASRLLTNHGIHIANFDQGAFTKLNLQDSFGEVQFISIPYAEPSRIKDIYKKDYITDHNSAMKEILTQVNNSLNPKSRTIVCAHTFISGSQGSDSERPLNVGGINFVEKALFENFTYTALGHLHIAQQFGNTIGYSGSLMKYSFSEVNNTNSVSLIDLNETRIESITQIPLPIKRNLSHITDSFDNLMKGSIPIEKRNDYLMITLTDREPILDPMVRLRELYPTILHMERQIFTSHLKENYERFDHTKLDDIDLFQTFMVQTTGNRMNLNEQNALKSVIDSLYKKDIQS